MNKQTTEDLIYEFQWKAADGRFGIWAGDNKNHSVERGLLEMAIRGKAVIFRCTKTHQRKSFEEVLSQGDLKDHFAYKKNHCYEAGGLRDEDCCAKEALYSENNSSDQLH